MASTVLTAARRRFLGEARRAILATLDGEGRPRLVPICFVVDPEHDTLYSPLDDKPKRTDDPRGLARVRDIEARPEVSVLVDRWDEDWTGLAWLRLGGRARLIDTGAAAPAGTIDRLRGRYPQYAHHRLEDRPMIAIAVTRASSWGDMDSS